MASGLCQEVGKEGRREYDSMEEWNMWERSAGEGGEGGKGINGIKERKKWDEGTFST